MDGAMCGGRGGMCGEGGGGMGRRACGQARLPPVPARLSPTMPPMRRRLTGACQGPEHGRTDGRTVGPVRGSAR